jgi:predicted MFS family arabinose efflux permease
MPLSVWALALAAFAGGTMEYVVVGLIPQIVTDLQVTEAQAGLLVSAFALGIVIGAPILTAILGAKFSRRNLGIFTFTIFTISCFISVFLPNYTTLMVARFASGLVIGVFYTIAFPSITQLVPEHKIASAIALFLSGLTVSMVTAVPFGIWVGHEYGLRATLLLISILSLIALFAYVKWIPTSLSNTEPPSLAQQFKVLIKGRLVLVYLLTALGFGGTFLVFTYIAVMLAKLTGMSTNGISWMLLLYGVSVIIGNILTGRLTDKLGSISSLTLVYSGLALVLILIGITIHSMWLTALVILFWGGFAFGCSTPVQSYVMQVAKKVTPDAVDVAVGVNVACFNIGIALGSWGGGSIINHFGLDKGLAYLPFIGGGVVILALFLTRLSGSIEKKVA